MHRLFAGVALLTLAFTACGGRAMTDPPPHIVAVGVPTTVPAPAPAVAAPVVVPVVAHRAARAETVRPAVATPITDDVWTRLARCESGGDPRAVGGGGRYFGAFQFSLDSWRLVGMTGNPIDHSYADQLAAAKRLQARSGWRNWPVCARRVLRA